MAKISEFLKALIVKAGGNVEDEKIKNALASINADAELQDDLVKTIDNGLISIANAKNNHPEIKNHYFAAAYNGLDSEIDRIMQDEKFSEDIITELKGEKSSTKRAVLLATKIKELEREKAGQGKAETRALNEKIAELQGLLRAEKDSINGIKTEYEKKLRDKDKSYAMRDLLGVYKTIYDTLDPETKSITVNAIIDKNMRSKGLKWEIDDNGNLTIQTKDGNNAFTDDHRPLTPKIFLDKLMADEKLLVVTDNNQNQNQNQQQNSGGFNRNNNNNSGGSNRNTHQSQLWGNSGNNVNNNPNTGNSVLKELLKRSQDDIANANKGSIF